MQTETYECVDYKCRLYKASDDILLLDIFVNKKEKHKISLSYSDAILICCTYIIKEIWHRDDVCEKIEEQKHYIRILINEIFYIPDFCIYTAGLVKNLISVTLIRKGLLKEFTPQIDENKINIKWMPLCKKS
jgi:hypothetical protein